MNKKKPILLIILDGWGFSTHHEYNAIFQAHPKMFNFLWDHYPHTLLHASGTAVGLPVGAIGNSEVGHLTIGAGSIIEQPITIINHAIQDGTFFKNSKLLDIMQSCIKKNGRLHLLGLLSDGLAHSSEEHLFALMKSACEYHVPEFYIHAFLDGRDVAPKSASQYLQKLDENIKKYGGKLGSICGRFYAMDRDENWSRTLDVFDMLCGKKDSSPLSGQKIIEQNYAHNITDEFIKPILLNRDAAIKNNDTLIFFNIRPDRIRQLIALFLNVQLPSQKEKKQPIVSPPKDLTVASMVQYDEIFHNTILFESKIPQDTLLDILEKEKKTIFTIAETEKYAHVTYFFSGGKETTRKNETRIVIPSKSKEHTYADVPEMSAPQITEKIIASLEKDPSDFYLINYANADMVGHSGNFASTVKAVLCVDEQLKKLYTEVIEKLDGTLYITADHGKAEEMWDVKNNCPRTAHTTNSVPFIMVQKNVLNKSEKLPLDQLADIKDFVLKNSF